MTYFDLPDQTFTEIAPSFTIEMRPVIVERPVEDTEDDTPFEGME